MRDRLSGIADEAGQDLATQIGAHQQLGWRFIELRNLSGQPVDALSGHAAAAVARQIADAGLTVNCLSSRLGNWQRHVDSDWQTEQAELERLIAFSQLTGNRFIRIMSYLNNDHSEQTWRDRVVSRIERLVAIARQGSVTLLHENCSGWAGRSAENSRYLLDCINSPHLQLLLDAGNGLAYQNSPADFIRLCGPQIAHVHIKDGVRESDGRVYYTFPGEGQARLTGTLAALRDAGYQGLYSIEPHIDAIVHEGRHGPESTGLNPRYLTYGNRALALLNTVLSEAGQDAYVHQELQ